MLKTLSVLLIALFSCSNGTAVENGNEAGFEPQDKEDFFIFFQRFCMDESFQLDRVKFPLEEIYLSEDLNSTLTKQIRKQDWEYKMLKDFKTNTFEYYFDSFKNKALPDKNEMVYSIIGLENGIQVNYYFQREKGKWYLVKIEDLST